MWLLQHTSEEPPSRSPRHRGGAAAPKSRSPIQRRDDAATQMPAPRAGGDAVAATPDTPATVVTRRHSHGANADTASVTEPVRPIHGGRGDKVTAPRRSRDHSHGAAAVKRHRRGRIRRGAPAHAGRSEDLSMTQPSCGSAWNSRRLSTQFLS